MRSGHKDGGRLGGEKGQREGVTTMEVGGVTMVFNGHKGEGHGSQGEPSSCDPWPSPL